MTAYTDDDVTAGGDAIIAARVECYGNETAARAVLAAVAPAIAARAEIVGIEKALARVDRYQAEHDAEVAARALREAADAMDTSDMWHFDQAIEYLRAAAEQVRCRCEPCPGRGNDGHGMTHCAECCFGTLVIAEPDCPVHGERARAEQVAE